LYSVTVKASELDMEAVVLGGLVVIVLHWNSVEDDGFLRVIKIHSTASFRREVKLSALCCKILQHVKDTCGVWQILHWLNSWTFVADSLLHYYVSAATRELVDESGLIRIQMGM
jgi:hypothetical protein